MPSPLRIFISHTSELDEYPADRSFVQAAKDAISAAGHTIVEMKHFGANHGSTAQVSIDRVNSCDVYVGLFGFRFGSPVPERPELSYTHLEFDTAGDKPDMKRLLFLLHEDAEGSGRLFQDRNHGHLQDAFRKRALDPQHTAAFFKSPDELEKLVYKALAELDPKPETPIPKPETPRPCIPPKLPPGYVHRPEEYEAIKTSLLAAEGASTVSISTAISGAGGFGKTTLAMKLCEDEDLRGHFDDILWVTLGKDNPDVLSRLSDVVLHLTGARPVADHIEAAAGALGEALGERKLLLVVDDVWRKADVRPFLRGGPNCIRLVTTRFADVAREGKGREIPLDEMKNAEAVEMLITGIEKNRVDDRAPLARLADRMGEYPLILNLANGYLRARINRGATVAEAAEYLDAR